MVSAELAREVTAALAVPTIGIGSGPDCDAQVLVLHDVLGMYPDPPPFVRRFADLESVAVGGLREYGVAVRERTYPPRTPQ
jgi:3-methyl-2-oxobutanoate hydroxymethyltransferase